MTPEEKASLDRLAYYTALRLEREREDEESNRVLAWLVVAIVGVVFGLAVWSNSGSSHYGSDWDPPEEEPAYPWYP